MKYDNSTSKGFGSMENSGKPFGKMPKGKPERFLRQTLLTNPEATGALSTKRQKTGGRAVVKKGKKAAYGTKRYPRGGGSKSQQYAFSRKVKPETA